MASTTRQSSAWHYGSGATWTTPSSYVYTGGSPANIARQTFSGQARIDNIGTISALSVYTDTLNTSINSGQMYVSASALAPNQVTTYASYIGEWYTPNGNPFWMAITNFNAANFVAGIGSYTTWYCYWVNAYTASRSFYSPSVHPIWSIGYTPGLAWVNVSGVWRSGAPFVNVGGTWKQGEAWLNVGGTWKPGT